jgi:hypothetical protein
MHDGAPVCTGILTLRSATLQMLYGILVQHFATLAGQSPLRLDHLDALTHVLAPATAEVLLPNPSS